MTISQAVLARSEFVSQQVAQIVASGHPKAQRWISAVLRAGEFFKTRAGRAEAQARCDELGTTITSCTCEAAQFDQPCKHRAFLRLVQKWAAS